MLRLQQLTAAAILWGGWAAAEQPVSQIIEITIAPCSIPKVDPKAAALRAASVKGCEKLNRATLKMRRAAFKPLRLRPGPYVFRVTNQSVSWVVDFSIKGARDGSLPKISGGRIGTGQTFDYPIVLRAGVYVFGSPSNPTPEYPLLVEN